MKLRVATVLVALLSLVQANLGQTQTTPASALPHLVRFGGTVKDLNGGPLTGVVGITFALYSEQTGGAPLWLETQNATADSTGHYTVLLGATKPEGLPAELFTSEQARWVGVQVSGQAEQPRVLLVSAPYALKAGDAETIGGLPPSAFVLAGPGNGGGAFANSSGATESSSASVPLPASSDVTTTGGTVNAIPLFSIATNIQNSILTQTAATAVNVGGKLNLPATAAATKTLGADSRPLDFVASSFSSTSSTSLNQTFQWQAEPTANDTAAPSGTLNLLYGLGTAAPTETGVKISSKGIFTFATGQTFPGTGTLTGVTTAAGSGLSGGGTTGTLSLKVPAAGITNAMLADSKITLSNNAAGGLTTPGAMTLGSSYTIGLKPCTTNQILQYNGTSWACANAGTGTVTTVESGAGLTGGPITASGTLSLAAKACPAGSALSALPFTCSLFATLGANTFIGTQSITGHNLQTLIGDPGCGSHPFAGIAFGSSGFSNCENYSMVGDSVNTYIAAPTGNIYFRTARNAVTAMTIAPSGTVSVYGLSASAGSGSSGADAFGATGGNGDPNDINNGNGGYGVQGVGGSGTPNTADGNNTGGNGVEGYGGSATFSGAGGVFASGTGVGNEALVAVGGLAGNFTGDLMVSGAITAGTKDFKIDHPLDPANKYLVHASVESSEMKNIYDGNVTTDSQGQATVQLPEWFGVLNTDFRYQLTVIGQFAQAIVGRKIENNQFEIRTSAPNVEVSWQVTGVRQDAFAKANPLVVELEKEPRLRGFYIHPELYGAPAEKQIEWARHPQTMKKIQEMRAKQLATAQMQAVPRN
jgi:hypothetical protein